MQQELEETKPTENSNTQRDLYVSLQTTIIRFLGWLTIVSLIKTTTQKMFPEKSFLVTMFSFIVKASLELLAVLQSLAHDCWGSLHTPLGLYHTKCNKRRQKVKKKKKQLAKPPHFFQSGVLKSIPFALVAEVGLIQFMRS